MSAVTGIEWTDRTWNPTTGCDKVSPGCAHCYAEVIADRFWAKQYPEVDALNGGSLDRVPSAYAERLRADKLTRPRRFTDVMTHEYRLLEPLSWRLLKERCPNGCSEKRLDDVTRDRCVICGGSGHHRRGLRIFVNSMSDLFHEDVPDEFIDKVFAVMALAPKHTFQILTKRPERMRAYFNVRGGDDDRSILMRETCVIEQMQWFADKRWRYDYQIQPWPLPNVWLGVSVENQHFASRVTWLLDTPAAVRFVSVEPQLGPVDLTNIEIVAEDGNRPPASLNALTGHVVGPDDILPTKLDWIIVGGESGPGARPFDLSWSRAIVQQCKAAGVACFVKQLGAKAYEGELAEPTGRFRTDPETGRRQIEVTATAIPLRNRKGGDPGEWPADLNVREFPEGAHP